MFVYTDCLLFIQLHAIAEYENKPRVSPGRFFNEYFVTGKVEKIEISFRDEHDVSEFYITLVTGDTFVVNANYDRFVQSIGEAENQLRIKPDQRFSR